MVKKILHNPQAILGLAIIFMVVTTAIFAPILAPNDPGTLDPMLKFQSSSIKFPLGTDQLGRCILSRMLFGARYSLGLAIPMLLALGVSGLLIGIMAGYFGGLTEKIFIVVSNIFMAFPPLILVMSLVGTLGQGTYNVVIAAIVSMWAWYARIVRTYTASEKAKPYVLACHISGCRHGRIIIRHILPNILPGYIVYLSLSVASLVLLISSFSFLGLGLPAGTPEWGAMLGEAKSSIYSHPMLVVWPGLCILFTAAGFNLFGEALRDIVSHGEVSL